MVAVTERAHVDMLTFSFKAGIALIYIDWGPQNIASISTGKSNSD